ncbi:sugar phosphate isomerase/epimerase family protein [Rubellimicrobium arenae]|uniref:sugar phosphate isomerase/epimerase family protein n=1 Tax=Rubellimicrobium arenae TaxID=2817372 RepID=UPI001B31139D|nr:sugar phosphate isomerase/epimerase [Rubellimicrobium arenae]
MQVGIFAKTFPGETPLSVLSAARGAGYDAVQYNMACSGLGALPASVADSEAAAIRAASEQTGVAIAAVSATYNMIHPDDGVRAAGRAAFAAIAGAAQAMGTDVVTVCTGSRDAQDQWRHHPDNSTAQAWSDFLAEMGLLLEIADRHDILVGVEPELANVASSAVRARSMLDDLDHPRLAVVLDPANLFETAAEFRGGAVIDEAIDLLSDRIVLAHAKDRAGDGRVVTLGQGLVDVPRFVARLRASGFDGALVTHGLTPEDAPAVARALRSILGDGCR